MNKLSKLLNVVIYLCIISYALPTGVMKGIPIQKILVCLLIILGGICLVLQRKSLEIIKSAKLEITLGVLGLLAGIVSYILGNEWSIKFTGLFYISVIVFVELYFLVRYELAEPEKIVECILYMMLLKILGKIIIEIVFVCKLIEYEAVIEFYLKHVWNGSIDDDNAFGQIIADPCADFIRYYSCNTDAVLLDDGEI